MCKSHTKNWLTESGDENSPTVESEKQISEVLNISRDVQTTSLFRKTFLSDRNRKIPAEQRTYDLLGLKIFGLKGAERVGRKGLETLALAINQEVEDSNSPPPGNRLANRRSVFYVNAGLFVAPSLVPGVSKFK